MADRRTAHEAVAGIETIEEHEALEVNFDRIRRSAVGVRRVIDELNRIREFSPIQGLLDVSANIESFNANPHAQDMNVVIPHDELIKPHFVAISNAIENVRHESEINMRAFFCERVMVQEAGNRTLYATGDDENMAVMCNAEGTERPAVYEYRIRNNPENAAFYANLAEQMITDMINTLQTILRDMVSIVRRYDNQKNVIIENLRNR